MSGDVRRYLRLGSRSAWALRAYGFYSGGDRPRRTNIGGTTALRGYPQFGYILGSSAWMANQEVRFPLLTHLTLGTPLGDLDFPEIQGAFFTDVGKASFESSDDRAVLGSYGISFRLATRSARRAALRRGPAIQQRQLSGLRSGARPAGRRFRELLLRA